MNETSRQHPKIDRTAYAPQGFDHSSRALSAFASHLSNKESTTSSDERNKVSRIRPKHFSALQAPRFITPSIYTRCFLFNMNIAFLMAMIWTQLLHVFVWGRGC